MTVSERMSNAGLVPVVVLENAADAVPTARALLAGGVDVMEITFRTAAAEDSIRAVAEECGEMVVGAGTVVTLEQCRRAVDAGAQFIVSPGYDDEVIMAAGAFVGGASIELSADGPMRAPYIAFMQGGLTYESARLGIMAALEKALGRS